jgi:multiple sugar transport system ATP-binding protein
VAGFIGSPAMNFLRGTVRVNGRATFHSDHGVSLPIEGLPRATDGQPVVYGVRPEHFVLDGSGVPAEVVVLEPTGSETQAQLRIGGQEVTGVFRERLNARPGEKIPVLPRPDLVHLFDPSSGKRLS